MTFIEYATLTAKRSSFQQPYLTSFAITQELLGQYSPSFYSLSVTQLGEKKRDSGGDLNFCLNVAFQNCHVIFQNPYFLLILLPFEQKQTSRRSQIHRNYALEMLVKTACRQLVCEPRNSNVIYWSPFFADPVSRDNGANMFLSQKTRKMRMKTI